MAQGWGLLADGVVVLHLAFILFALLGGLLVLRRPRLAWLHLPALLWAAYVELAGWVCPLTPLENRLRRASGGSGYRGDFVEHYVLPVVYPEALTRELQVALGLGLLVLNACVYAWIWHSAGGSTPTTRGNRP